MVLCSRSQQQRSGGARHKKKKGEEYVLCGAGVLFIYYPLCVLLANRQETLRLSWYCYHIKKNHLEALLAKTDVI